MKDGLFSNYKAENDESRGGGRRGTRDWQPKRLILSKNIEDSKGLSPLM